MTRQKFYRNLRRIVNKFNWKIDLDGNIRGYKNRSFCPITAVAFDILGEKFSLSEYVLAGKELGLDIQDIDRIAVSADNNIFLKSYNAMCHKTLLKSVGINRV